MVRPRSPQDAQDRLCLLSVKHSGILTQFQTKVKKKFISMLDSGCLILEKSFTVENADFAEKVTKSTDFESKFWVFGKNRFFPLLICVFLTCFFQYTPTNPLYIVFLKIFLANIGKYFFYC